MTESWTFGTGSRFRVCRGTDLRWATTRMDQHSAKKCRGGFLDWEHAIPQPFSHFQPPWENKRQRRRSHGVPILKSLHHWASLLLREDLLSPSLSKSNPLAQALGHCLGLSVWLHSCLFLTPLQIQRHIFFVVVPLWVSEGSTGSCHCGLAPLYRCAKSNDIIIWFVQRIIEWRPCSPGVSWQYKRKHTSPKFPMPVCSHLEKINLQLVRNIIISLSVALLIWLDKRMGNPMFSVSVDSDRAMRPERLRTHKSFLPLSAQRVVLRLHVIFHSLLGSLSLARWIISLKIMQWPRNYFKKNM